MNLWDADVCVGMVHGVSRPRSQLVIKIIVVATLTALCMFILRQYDSAGTVDMVYIYIFFNLAQMLPLLPYNRCFTALVGTLSEWGWDSFSILRAVGRRVMRLPRLLQRPVFEYQ